MNGFRFQLRHFLAACPWASSFTSEKTPVSSFCEMRRVATASWVAVRDQGLTFTKRAAECARHAVASQLRSSHSSFPRKAQPTDRKGPASLAAAGGRGAGLQGLLRPQYRSAFLAVT